MADNIGGIPHCWCVPIEDVKHCAVYPDRQIVECYPGKEFMKIPATPSRSDVQVTPADDGLGGYDVSVSISIPSDKAGAFLRTARSLRRVLFLYQTACGDVFVVGDKEHGLDISIQRLSPSSASGYSGLQINLTGLIPHQELPLSDTSF